jgi:Host cell surface-exposed lipoprotein
MKKIAVALVVVIAALSLTGSALAASAGQRNAVSTAQDYLAYQAFSKPGLTKQLKFEHFSAADARYAVNHIRVNWSSQAVKSAKAYLDYQSFSRQGLIKQLEFEGFTRSQAAYGVSKAYH